MIPEAVSPINDATGTPPVAPRDIQSLVRQLKLLGKDVVAPAAAEVDANARFPFEAFEGLRELRLLGCLVPRQLGGDGLTLSEVCRLCEVLGEYCASTAMVFAMHQIQVACLVNHGNSDYLRDYLAKLCEHQYLLASATTEVGIGGDIRTSDCALVANGDRLTLVKKAPVISYGEQCDAVLATCRRAPEAPAGDQVQVLLHRAQFQLEPLSGWDTLGFRGTCSRGFVLTGEVAPEQVLPDPFDWILNRTMQPVSHLTWGALWNGLATDAVRIARGTVINAARKDPGSTPASAVRLAEAHEQLQLMQSLLAQALSGYESMGQNDNPNAYSDYAFVISINNLKLKLSELAIDVVSRCLQIAGIAGYRNDSQHSLGKHLRDAYGASIMVSNDRIRGHNAMLQTALR